MDVQQSRSNTANESADGADGGPEERVWLREQFHRANEDLKAFASGQGQVDDDYDADASGAPRGVIGWFRLLLAMTCLIAVVYLTGQRFVNYAVHHVWMQARNSPMALIVPVLAVEFLWIIAHVHTGGMLSRLKIGLGAAAICVAFFAPSFEALAGAGRSMDVKQIAALSLAAWVFIDGWRDRRFNLDHDQQRDLASQRT